MSSRSVGQVLGKQASPCLVYMQAGEWEGDLVEGWAGREGLEGVKTMVVRGETLGGKDQTGSSGCSSRD